MIKYDNSKMECCEYIEAMRKIYAKRPDQNNGRCTGFKNPYSSKISRICAECKFLKERDNK